MRYIWGDVDALAGPDAARGTGEFVSGAFAGEKRVLPGARPLLAGERDQAPRQGDRLER